MRTIIFMLALLLAGGSANASILEWFQKKFGGGPVDYGYWECLNCTAIPGPGVAPDPALALPGEMYEFIRLNNPAIHDSAKEGKIYHPWKTGSQITLCNETRCMALRFAPLPISNWAPQPGMVIFNRPLGKTIHQGGQEPQSYKGTVEYQGVVPDYDYGTFILILFPDKVPSVQCIENCVVSSTGSYVYSGTPAQIPAALETPIGNALDWGPESAGLTFGGGGGGCGYSCGGDNGRITAEK